jgi:pimeloyl-ACP methyl ester carboxylesterase
MIATSYEGIMLRQSSAAVFMMLAWLAFGPSFAADVPSRYIRSTPGRDTVIIFVHGVVGDSYHTWANQHSYWPEMMGADTTFDGSDIYVYSYPTSLWATMSIDELAENMRLQLYADGVTKHKKLIYLAHSMGGLVTRAFLLKNPDVAQRTFFAYFYSTPTTGSDAASLASLLSLNPQFGKMKPMNADDYLADELRAWLATGLKFPSYCAYEKRKTYGLAIVTMQSASALCNQRLDPIDADHIDIVKPIDSSSISYLAFKAAYQKETDANSPVLTVAAISDLVVTPLKGDRVRGLPGYPLLVDKDDRVYAEGAQAWLGFSDNLKGTQKIVVRRVTPVAKFVSGANPRLAYSVQTAQLGGAGVTTPRQFVVRLNGQKEPSVAWVDNAGNRKPTASKNLLDTTPPILLTLDPNDNSEEIGVSIVTMQPGTYEVAFEIGYSVGGEDKVASTNPIHIYRK